MLERRFHYATNDVSCPVLGRLPRPTAQPADHILPSIIAIPIAIVLGAVDGGTWQWTTNGTTTVHTTTAGTTTTTAIATGVGGLLFFAPLLMIVFRRKYPRWWFDWNIELQRFSTRFGAYIALMDDRYPSTTDYQSVYLDYAYPDVERELNQWLPLVKWFLAIPHYIVLFFLNIALVVVVIIAWCAILFTGHYPRRMFDFVEGVIR